MRKAADMSSRPCQVGALGDATCLGGRRYAAMCWSATFRASSSGRAPSSVAPARQRRGIATAVVRELIERGRRAGLCVAVAHTLAEENASAKVLTRCGFTRTAELDDPDEGRVWRWELRLRP